MKDKIAKEHLDRTMAKGSLVNVLGMLGKVLFPVFLILLNRLYGTTTVGYWMVAYSAISVVLALTVSGINDGVLMFAARYQEDSNQREEKLYGMLANGFVISLAISFLCIAAAQLGGDRLLAEKFQQAGVAEGIVFLTWSLPFQIIPIIVIAATKALIMMKWEALIQGFLAPLLLLLFSIGFYFNDVSLQSLLKAYLLTYVSLTAVSLLVFARYFSYIQLFKAMLGFRLSLPLIKFAIPQNLNMTFNTFITRLDVVMLGYFAVNPKLIAFYSMGAEVVRNIRQIKLAFSGVYAPIIARLHKRGDREGMNLSFSMISRWTATLAFPVALIVAFFRNELLLIFHRTYVYDTTFMLLLLIPPLLSCTTGLAGNIIVMTGHSLWNLLNSFVVAGLNLVLNYVLIPKYGLIGAAVASALASLAISVMQLVEVQCLVKARIMPRKVYKPYLAIVPGVALLSGYTLFFEVDSHLFKGLCSLAGVALFVVLLVLLKLEEEDRRTLLFWKYKKPADE
ncbi:MAG: polysaccharide biosynthesis C-terminal domain-containing protein [Myxococcota bacterium]|nr:polysaccharide biosynthesis C-terminal domain-containing protein [Myxococcota bacterium]